LSTVGQKEKETQKRVIAFFRDSLGYDYLGNWHDRDGNSNVDEDLLSGWLKRQGHSSGTIGKVLRQIGKATAVGGGKTLYDANRELYGRLRYGANISPGAGQQNELVPLVNWDNANHVQEALEQLPWLAAAPSHTG